MAREPELMEFGREESAGIVEIMDRLAGGGGWLNLDPGVAEEHLPPKQSALERVLSGRGPWVPRATWVPARFGRRPEPMSVGVLHGSGPGAEQRLAEREHPVPPGWKVVGDHAKRGLVAWVPVEVPHSQVLGWLQGAVHVLTVVPLLDTWRVAVYE